MNAPLQAQTKVTPPSPTAVSVVPTGLLQRKCACGGSPGVEGECAACRKRWLQRQPAGQAEPVGVPSIVHEVLRTPGQPLDPPTRAFMEPRFGHDFGAVRVHTDALAAQSAQSVNALAYTVGRDVVFASGQYAPGVRASQRLLAHELTHVVQQRGDGALQWRLEIGPAVDLYEREADLMAHRIFTAERPQAQDDSVRSADRGLLPDGSISAPIRLQRWSYGTGAPPHPDYAEVPDADRPRLEAAMSIVSRIVNNTKDFGGCHTFFKDNCPGGTDTTLTNVFNRAELWKDTDADPDLLASSVPPDDFGYTQKSYNVGRWAVAASVMHEFIHLCGQASHDIGDDAKTACGRLPNI